ncbi:hypothetical protein BC940DRAFT_149570 [Gongronella butleri]|nr:hypothetical protein BC940DRAFT_149570 [Gongronella butleri]
MRIISNGGGALAPHLAKQMQECFPNAVVMPSYGMTECMPMTAPPRDYDLDCEGSSGLPIGPEMAIAADGMMVAQDGVIGHIMVRGPPCFEGYEGVDIDTAFDANGWFDTGDVGYFKDSYLYITGRSKEIINRGGEVISPLEIEQALISHPKLAQVMAFSTPHETLQETIGLILVVKENESRPDLRSLRPFLERVLHPSKWPQLLVYMSDLPKSAVNKPLRINVSQRMQLPTVMEADGNIHQKQHLYEADCPEAGAPLDELISCRPVQWENQQLLDELLAHPDVEDGATYVHPATKQLCVFLVASQQNKTANTTTTTLPVETYSTVIQMDDGSDNESSRASTMMNWRHDKEAKEAIVQRVQLYLERHIHDYMLPKRMLVVDHLPEKNLDGSLDDDHARHLLDQHQHQQPDDGTHANDPVVVALRDLFAQVLGLSKNDYPLDGDFFDHGGNSLKSSSLFSLIRVRLAIDLPLTLLYEKNARSPVQLAPHCYERIDVKTHPLVTLGYDAYMKRPRTTSMLSYTTNTSILMDDASKKKKLKRRLRTPQAFRSFGTQKYKDRMAKRPDSGAYDPFSLISMVWQALPAFFFMPLGIGIRWLIFAMSLGSLSQVMPTTGASHSILRLVQVILALVITSILANVLAPVVAITSKWLLIGRYRAGKYRLWSWYYLRWWLAYRFVLISGPGILACSGRTFSWYLRMLGAKVGRGCSINVEIDIGEFDLLVIGDHCSLDKVNLRPFHLERGHMVLEPITIGNNCAVGHHTVIVSGTSIPSNHVIGPMTTTYARDMANVGSCAHKDTPEGMALLDAVMVGSMTSNRLHPILYCSVVLPVMGLLYLVSMIPWMIVMYMLSKDLSVVHSVSRGSLFSKLVLYFAGPSRVGYHLLAVAVKHNVVPILHLMLAIIIKRLFMKRTVPGARTDDNQLTELRYALQRALLDPKELSVVFSMLGSHYELVSIVYRLLGAKVGKRVYWPGTCINTYDYDLIEVGDDVVFGSRSSFFCMDAHDKLPIKVRDGAMIADNCALYPGAEVGHGALLGTGGLLNKHGHVPDGSAWYGSFNGQPVKFRDEAPSEKKTALNGNGTGPDDEILGRRVFDNPGTPFGRAFYQGKSSYFVLGFWFVVPYNILARMVGSVYWGCAVTTAIQLSAIFIRANDEAFSSTPSDAQHQSFLSNLFHDGHEWIEVGIVLGAIIVLWNFMTVLGLALEIGCKWTLFGQRQPGQYNWDQSSYCQRWQILISFQQMFRRHFTHLAGGSAWVILYFRLFGARIGRRVCLYPNGGDPVMTEPDLVMLEDDVAVDFASLVCHMNTLGSFTVNPLKVGAGSVLRTGARLASGATMMEDCTLLEHTLILPGAVADRGTTWQGYPGEQVKHA